MTERNHVPDVLFFDGRTFDAPGKEPGRGPAFKLLLSTIF